MPRARLALCLLLLGTLGATAAAPPPLEQWIAVVAPGLRPALSPLAAQRLAQGFRVVVLSTADTSSDPVRIRDRIRRLCRSHPGPSHVLLVGSVDAPAALRSQVVVPPFPGSVGRMKGQPTDAPYGCLEDSRLPTVAVGRLPARTNDELKVMVARTLALERDRVPGTWRHQLTVLAGIPAYNPVVDRLVENLAFARFDRISPIWTGRALYTSATSRFCVPDAYLRKQAISHLQKGQAFVLYLGHSNAEGLYAGPTASFLDRDAWSKLSIRTGGSVFITFGCNGCQLSGRDGEGYGLYAIRNPRGPAAVLGSHGICFAAMVQLAAEGLFQRAFQEVPARRAGELWLSALQGVAKGKIDFLTYRMLDAVDGDSRIPQATQRQEHLEMFVLLGDPALRLPVVPADVVVDPLPVLVPGKTFVVRGKLPGRLRGARVRVSLERSPGSMPADLQEVPALPASARARVMMDNHARANRFWVVRADGESGAEGDFAVSLEVPAKLPWSRLALRVYAADANHEAMTVRKLDVTRPED